MLAAGKRGIRRDLSSRFEAVTLVRLQDNPDTMPF